MLYAVGKDLPAALSLTGTLYRLDIVDRRRGGLRCFRIHNRKRVMIMSKPKRVAHLVRKRMDKFIVAVVEIDIYLFVCWVEHPFLRRLRKGLVEGIYCRV